MCAGGYGSEACFVALAAGHYGEAEGVGHGHGIVGDGDGCVHQHGVGTHFHGFGGVRRSAEAGVNHHRDVALLNDDLQQVAGNEPFVSAYRGGEGHHGGGPCFFQ